MLCQEQNSSPCFRIIVKKNVRPQNNNTGKESKAGLVIRLANLQYSKNIEELGSHHQVKKGSGCLAEKTRTEI